LKQEENLEEGLEKKNENETKTTHNRVVFFILQLIINFIIFTKIIFMKKLIISVFFQIGVNVIGLPLIVIHDLSKTVVSFSNFHR